MDVSWDVLDELCEHHGDSFFHLDTEAFRRNYEEFTAAFRAIYPRTTIGYSYKTNYVPRLGQMVQRMGGYAEVVSGMEYELARRIGVPGDRIIFNGPFKPAPELEAALLAGSVGNLDSGEELDVVERLAARAPQAPLRVGLRCNVDLGTPNVSRFGFDVEDPAFAEAIARLRAIPGCEFVGLHLHASTGDRSPESYALRTKRLLELTAEHFGAAPPRILNVGGGYFGKMDDELRAQFPGPIATYQDYARAVASPVRAFYGDREGPELIVEPGTALTADVVTFVARVVGVKQVRTRSVALVAGSVHNIKPTGHTKTLPVSVIGRRRAEAPGTPVDIVGYTCMEHDVLVEGHPGAVDPGDFVAFRNVGAYTIVMQPPFIRPAPPVLARDPGSGRCEVLRRRETAADVFATYTL